MTTPRWLHNRITYAMREVVRVRRELRKARRLKDAMRLERELKQAQTGRLYPHSVHAKSDNEHLEAVVEFGIAALIKERQEAKGGVLQL